VDRDCAIRTLPRSGTVSTGPQQTRVAKYTSIMSFLTENIRALPSIQMQHDVVPHGSSPLGRIRQRIWLAHFVGSAFTAGVVVGTTPIAFQTNDDAVLKALANGSYTGVPEISLIFASPLFGAITSNLYGLAPSYDWYTFSQVFLVVFSAILLARSIGRGIAWQLNVLTIAVLGFVTCRFLFPLQFTQTSILATLSGTIWFARSKLSDWRNIVLAMVLIQIGLSIRPEAGLLTLALFLFTTHSAFVLPHLKERFEVVRNFIARALLLVLIVIVTLLLQQFNTPPSPMHTNYSKLIEALSSNDEGLLSIGFDKAEVAVLRETRGMYHDTPGSIARVSLLSQNSLGFSLHDIVGALETLVSREYYSYLVILAILVSIWLTINRGSSRQLVTTIGSTLGLTCIAMILLNHRFGRLPYRMLMPIWASIIILTLCSLLNLTNDRALQISGSATHLSGYSKTTRSLAPRKGLTVATLLVALMLCLSTVRYLSSFVTEYNSQSQNFKSIYSKVQCVSRTYPVVFIEGSSHRYMPGGAVVPSVSSSIYDLPVVVNDQLQYLAPFKRRAETLRVETDGSLLTSLELRGSAILANQQVIKKLETLIDSRRPRNTLRFRPDATCGSDVWRIDKVSLPDS